MNDLRNMISAAATTFEATGKVANETFRGLKEDAHAVCHVSKACNITPNKAENLPEVRVQPRLSVSISESDSAICQLCHLGHKPHRDKDLGKVLTFSTGEEPESALELHHLCGSLALRGDKTIFTVEELQDALEEAKTRRCHACNASGAFIQCCYGDCPRWYHLGCSMNATDVVIDVALGQLYCPKHTVPDSDDSNGDELIFDAKPKKQRSIAGSKAASATRRKQPISVQRPRTDWQRRGSNTWVKVVPPWWAEQKTVHFANKVFRELFQNNLEVDLIDDKGISWKCEVVKETRNDMRLQFTLMGQFQELWAHACILPGDVLTFEKIVPGANYDALTTASIASTTAPHVIKMIKHSQGIGFEDLMVPKAKKPRASSAAPGNAANAGTMRSGTGTVLGDSYCHATRSTRSTCSAHAIQASQAKIVTQETPWFFTSDRIARKVMHPNNVAKIRCPMTDELVAKIAGDVSEMFDSAENPANIDRGAKPASYHNASVSEPTTNLGPTFAVYDPVLRRHFVFDVESRAENKIRYITGAGFLAWMVEAGMKPEDSIQLMFTEGTTGRGHNIVVSKIPNHHTPQNQEILARAPSSDCSSNTSMKTLAAAACYCHTHGTPGIKALLDLPSCEQEIQAMAASPYNP